MPFGLHPLGQAYIDVVLYEMRPQRNTPAHTTDQLAELICSNSLGSNLPDRASGLLKAELRLLNSLIMRAADETAVPAGVVSPSRIAGAVPADKAGACRGCVRAPG